MLKSANRVLFLFTGQGSQFPQMFQKTASPQIPCLATRIFERRTDAVTSTQTSCIANLDNINDTREAQPAIYNLQCALFEQLLPGMQQNRMSSTFMGHSIGQYSALACAGALSYEDGLEMVLERARLMARAGEDMFEAFKMVAVILRNLESMSVEQLVRQVVDDGRCDVANINSNKQVVLSGSATGVDSVIKELGVRGVPLKVSAPFHSRYMESAAQDFDRYLHSTYREVERGDSSADGARTVAESIICNTTARPFDGKLSTLADQIVRTVQWKDSVEYVFEQDERRPDVVIEIGPKSVLIPLLTDAQKESTKCVFIGNEEDLNQVL